MHPPTPEHRRIQVTYGAQTNGATTNESQQGGLGQLAALHPFTQQERPQLDVVYPASSSELRDKLSQLSTQHYERQWKLSEFATFAEAHAQKFSAESDMIALGKPGPLDDDVWCVDTRGILTLAVCKTTYERLGLVGKPLPWKEHQHTFTVRISLRSQAPALEDPQCHAFGPKVKKALDAWDQRRGLLWDVVFHVPEHPVGGASQLRKIEPVIRTLRDVHIPKPIICARPTAEPKDSSAADEWDEAVGELFEWAGLACLGSERLRVNDKPDPYIAVYAPPPSAEPGDLVHICWRGFLSPAFVQSVINAATQAPFACVVANSVSISPVVYVPPPPSLRYPRRAARSESEDCWSLAIAHSEDTAAVQWLLAESVGRWDSRWG